MSTHRKHMHAHIYTHTTYRNYRKYRKPSTYNPISVRQSLLTFKIAVKFQNILFTHI